MRSSNVVIKVLAAMLWCVLSVGCVAEVIQPVAIEKSKVVEQSVPGTEIRVQDDELYFTDEYLDIIFACYKDGPCLFIFDDIAVDFGPFVSNQFKKDMGKVYWPSGFTSKTYKNYKDKKVTVYCKAGKERNIGFWAEREEPIKACSISSDKKYFIKFLNQK